MIANKVDKVVDIEKYDGEIELSCKNDTRDKVVQPILYFIDTVTVNETMTWLKYVYSWLSYYFTI